jgi:hypothetical protein
MDEASIRVVRLGNQVVEIEQDGEKNFVLVQDLSRVVGQTAVAGMTRDVDGLLRDLCAAIGALSNASNKDNSSLVASICAAVASNSDATSAISNFRMAHLRNSRDVMGLCVLLNRELMGKQQVVNSASRSAAMAARGMGLARHNPMLAGSVVSDEKKEEKANG